MHPCLAIPSQIDIFQHLSPSVPSCPLGLRPLQAGYVDKYATNTLGIDLTQYQNKIYVLSNRSPCAWTGLSTLGCMGESCRIFVQVSQSHQPAIHPASQSCQPVNQPFSQSVGQPPTQPHIQSPS